MKILPFAAIAALLILPTAAWADHNPDFDDDAKPILRMQPGLLEFVQTLYQVKDAGIAKIPGNDDRQAMPPYIFRAKPRGYPGDYYITLLIQPGPPGHILKIVDPTKPHGGSVPSYPPQGSQGPGSYAPQQPPPQGYASSSDPSDEAPVKKAPTSSTSTKTQPPPSTDTPSGPIASNSGGVTPLPPPPSSNPPSLEPPPDPPPASR